MNLDFMPAGLTDQIDLAEVLVIIFGLFFAGLVFYLRREDKREGYPLEDEIPETGRYYLGFPEPPPPKRYTRLDGGSVVLPQTYAPPPLLARPRFGFGGAPLYPEGDPLLACVGPGAAVLRRDTPFLLIDGSPQLVPLRNARDFSIVSKETDARGMTVYGSDNVEVGSVYDLWVDKGVKIIRYIEIALKDGDKHRLMPVYSARIYGRDGFLRIDAIKAAQVRAAPILTSPDIITAREEDHINAYFAGGALYAIPVPEAVA